MAEAIEMDWDLICERCHKHVKVRTVCYKTAITKADSQHECPHEEDARARKFSWAFPVGESVPLQ